MTKLIIDHEQILDRISEETYNCYRLLKLPKNVFESGKYFLKKMGNINTKSVKKIMASVILATRKQKYILSLKEIEDFFFDRYGIKFSWNCINKLLIKFDYNSFTAKDYFEKILYFYCPFCSDSSFYSQYQSGCNVCGFKKPMDLFLNGNPFEESITPTRKQEKSVLKYHSQKQRKKNWWLKSGLWRFHVRAYVKSYQTKNKLSREEIEEFVKNL